MRISQLASSIGESATLKLNEEAARLRALGEPVIHFGAGEPNGAAPSSALQGSIAKLNTGEIKYTPTDGTPSLKKAIIGYTEHNYARLVAPENVIVASGAKQALFNALFAILNPQDEVVIPAPYWVSYPEMVKMMRGVPVIVESADEGFVPRMADIEKAVTARTRAIIMNSPNNPSGAVYPAELIQAVVEFCEKHEIYLIMDDIYHKLVFDGLRVPNACAYATQPVDNSCLIIINGVSKLYGMTGFRIGWAVAARNLVGPMTIAQSQTTSCPSTLSQAGAEAALLGPQDVVDSLRQMIQDNRDVMVQELSKLDRVKLIKPAGTFYCLPDFSAYNPNSVELSMMLLNRALVVTVPGQPFGAEGHLRLSCTGTRQEIEEGVRRIKWALDPNSPDEIHIGDHKLVRDWA